MTLRDSYKIFVHLAGLLLLFLCGTPGCAPPTSVSGKMKIAAVFSTPLEEPWPNVIHQALLEAERELDVVYDVTEDVATTDIERLLREYAERGYEVIFGDAFGNEETARLVARDYPEIAFCFGSGLGPVEPNFSVFDNWVHEPAYLCGMIAGKLTETDTVGAVGGKAVPEVNRLLNAFRLGAEEVNPGVRVKISFIGSWFDPPKAKEAAIAQIESGADLIYGERYGVIEACQQKGVLAFGNLQDQNSLAPDTVITGPVWNMWPTVRQVISDVRDERYQAMDYRQWSMMGKGGAYLAPYHSFEKKLPSEVKEIVADRRREIFTGIFRVPVSDLPPRSD